METPEVLKDIFVTLAMIAGGGFVALIVVVL